MSATVRVVCTNPNCGYYQSPREVGLTHLGQDVYVHPSLVCVCNPRQELLMLPDEDQPESQPMLVEPGWDTATPLELPEQAPLVQDDEPDRTSDSD